MLTTGQRIKKLRKARGYSREQLAEILGCHYTAIAKWEADSRIPRGDNLVALAVALDVPVVELLTGKGEDHER